MNISRVESGERILALHKEEGRFWAKGQEMSKMSGVIVVLLLLG